jgi:RAB protein geranylgeranyltransferase component A
MVKTEEITNSQDYIDSREIIARIEELENATVNFGQVEELQHLKALTEEAEGYYEVIGFIFG